jgi:hypothetical protein
MSTINSRMCDIHAPVPDSAQSGEVRCVYGEVDLAVIGDLVVADIINLCPLPAGHVPVDALVWWDDLGDTGAATCGLTDDGDEGGEDEDSMIAAASLDFSSAGLARMTLPTGAQHEPVNYDRKFGLKVTEVSTAGAGKIGMTLFYRAKQSYQEVA